MVRIWEHGQWGSSVYHAVYELHGIVVDLYWQPAPMTDVDFLLQLQSANPTLR